MNNTQCKKELINECELGTDDCHADAKCSDLGDGFDCRCNVGYAGPGTHCYDQNECLKYLSDTLCSDPNSNCVNSIGSYSCACVIGFRDTNSAAQQFCSDIDECENEV